MFFSLSPCGEREYLTLIDSFLPLPILPRNESARREVRGLGHHKIPRGRDLSKTGAEGATAPETLRQKDRAGDELLESERRALRPPPKG